MGPSKGSLVPLGMKLWSGGNYFTILSANLSGKTDSWHVWKFTQFPFLWWYKQYISGHHKWEGRPWQGGKCGGVNLLLKISQAGFLLVTWGTVEVVHPIFMSPWWYILWYALRNLFYYVKNFFASYRMTIVIFMFQEWIICMQRHRWKSFIEI